ncbi:hypothetical protein [Endozoicomonas arenosclerae]|uniref:hypothetical protein n=1 Tax=Endozoicomonas arenosclerae TaxID=1633495 RepID=UPI000782C36F|nr:hypothetical protein [Endozoicomonas arenosclerae]
MLRSSNKAALHLQTTTDYERHEWFIDPELAAQQSHRSLSTVYKWIQGQPIDPASQELLNLKSFGVLPFKPWAGFKLRPDGLITPSGHYMAIHELVDTGFMMAVYHDTKKINEELLFQLRTLKQKKGQCCH